MSREIQPGDFVLYTAEHTPELGRVKSIPTDGSGPFVVYNCAGEWDNYENYTAAKTDWNDLRLLRGFTDYHKKLQSKIAELTERLNQPA